MEHHPSKPMTPFDRSTIPDWLYMMKLMLPYTPAKIQHSLAIFIRFQEMQYTLKHFSIFTKKSSDTILNDIKPYMDPSTQEMMEQMESMMNMMEMMQNFQDDNPMDILSGMMGSAPSDSFNMKGDSEHE